MKSNSSIKVNRFTKFSMILLVLAFVVSSCSNKKETCVVTEKDGVNYYQNKIQGSNPELKIVIEKEIDILGISESDSSNSFSQSSDIEIDGNGNYYIFDNREQKVFKYDNSGKFLTSFCGKGQGPAEIDGAQDIAIVGDSLFISSPAQAKIAIFDLNGNFGEHRAIIIPGLYYGQVDIGISNNSILGYIPTIKVDKKVTIGNDIVIKDKNYKKSVLIHSIPPDKEPSDIEGAKIIFMPFAYFNNKVYYVPDFPNSYKINVKDTKGNLKSVITKFSRKIEYNPEEKEHYDKSASFSWNGQQIIPDCKFKAVINKVYTDKFGHLLAWVSIDRKSGTKHNPSIDLFKDGKFLNTINLDVVSIVEAHTPDDVIFQFKGGKLIVYDTIENIYSIYNYNYENLNI